LNGESVDGGRDEFCDGMPSRARNSAFSASAAASCASSFATRARSYSTLLTGILLPREMVRSAAEVSGEVIGGNFSDDRKREWLQKALKTALVFRDAPFRPVHDLRELGMAVAALDAASLPWTQRVGA
jgi:hypothetical protein